MNKEDLSDSVGEIRDDYLDEALQAPKKKGRRGKLLAAAAAVALATLAAWGAIRFLPRGTPSPPEDPSAATQDETQSAEPTEPTTKKAEAAYITPQPKYMNYAEISALYPDLTEISWDQREAAFGYSAADIDALPDDWYRKTLPVFLQTENGGNAAFSPLNLLISLATLTEISGGESRAQLTELLGVDDAETLRKAVKAIWFAAYRNSDAVSTESRESKEGRLIPANSFWLNKHVRVEGDASIAEILKTDYFTSFFRGAPNDPAFTDAYRAWINDQTGGLLEDAVRDMAFDDTTLFKLVSTLFLKGEWIRPFDPALTFSGTFHAADGDTSAQFMYEENAIEYYFETDDFTAASKSSCVGNVWFILPAKGKTPEDLVNSGAYTAILNEYKTAEENNPFRPAEGYDMYMVDLTVPKFDFSDNLDLKAGMMKLGVTDLFDAEKAEIPFLRYHGTMSGRVFLSAGTQDLRVAIDEQGVSAAAATIWSGGFGAPRFQEVSLTADRPFLFLIETGGIPLFAGIVNSAA